MDALYLHCSLTITPTICVIMPSLPYPIDVGLSWVWQLDLELSIFVYLINRKLTKVLVSSMIITTGILEIDQPAWCVEKIVVKL